MRLIKRLASSLHELHESKLLFVSRIEFFRSKLSDFSAHVSGVIGGDIEHTAADGKKHAPHSRLLTQTGDIARPRPPIAPPPPRESGRPVIVVHGAEITPRHARPGQARPGQASSRYATPSKTRLGKTRLGQARPGQDTCHATPRGVAGRRCMVAKY